LTDEIEKKIYEVFQKVHELGIVHNDIRPENILVSWKENSVWLIDFEFAQAGDEYTSRLERDAVTELIAQVKNGESVPL